MESVATVLSKQYGNLTKVHDNMICNNTCTKDALNRDKANHVNIKCTTDYEKIPPKEYGLLLRKMESWNITAPKAIVKRYGVFIVKRAVAYTEATPNVRNKAGYMTYMCQQFKKDTETNHVEQNPKPQSETREVKEEKCINTPKNDLTPIKPLKTIPQINDYKSALTFVCDFNDGFYGNDDKIDEFARKIKKKYNFA